MVLHNAAKARGDLNSRKVTSSLKGLLKLFKEGIVGQSGSKSLEYLTVVAGVLSWPIKALSSSCSIVQGALLFSFRHSLEVNYYSFPLFLSPLSFPFFFLYDGFVFKGFLLCGSSYQPPYLVVRSCRQGFSRKHFARKASKNYKIVQILQRLSWPK